MSEKFSDREVNCAKTLALMMRALYAPNHLSIDAACKVERILHEIREVMADHFDFGALDAEGLREPLITAAIATFLREYASYFGCTLTPDDPTVPPRPWRIKGREKP